MKKELKETLDLVVMGANAPTRLYGGKEIETWKYWENVITNEKINAELYKEYSDGMAIEPITKMYFLGAAGSLKVGAYKNGELVQVGNLSGLDEEILLNWRDYIGKVCEVAAMEVMDTGGIRHPKFSQWRNDKPAEDCDWFKIFGNE